MQAQPAPAAAPAAQPWYQLDPRKNPGNIRKNEKKPSENKPPKEKTKPGRLLFGLPKLNISVDPAPLVGIQDITPGNSSTHRSKFTSNALESFDDKRTSIENVARPGGKTRIGKQAQIKAKIIDENADKVDLIKRVRAEAIAKKKEQTPIILNPKLKNPDEGSK